VNLQPAPAVIVDEPQFPEPVQKETFPCHRMMMKSMPCLHGASCMLQGIVASNDTSVPSGNEHSCSE
jgi:hypothetical protein